MKNGCLFMKEYGFPRQGPGALPRNDTIKCSVTPQCFGDNPAVRVSYRTGIQTSMSHSPRFAKQQDGMSRILAGSKRSPYGA